MTTNKQNLQRDAIQIRSRGFREKLREGVWNELNQDEQELAAALLVGLGLLANKFMSTDVIRGAAEVNKLTIEGLHQ